MIKGESVAAMGGFTGRETVLTPVVPVLARPLGRGPLLPARRGRRDSASGGNNKAVVDDHLDLHEGLVLLGASPRGSLYDCAGKAAAIPPRVAARPVREVPRRRRANTALSFAVYAAPVAGVPVLARGRGRLRGRRGQRLRVQPPLDVHDARLRRRRYLAVQLGGLAATTGLLWLFVEGAGSGRSRRTRWRSRR